MVIPNSPAHRWARRLGAAGFLAYGISAIAIWKPDTATECFWIALRSLLAAGLVLGLAQVTVPAVVFVYAATLGRPTASADPAGPPVVFTAAPPEPALTPEPVAVPQPTAEERVAVAKARYEAALRLLETSGLDETELRSGREQAKQRYVRELDEVMK